MTKYIFVTGGVVTGLGKGITASSPGLDVSPPEPSAPAVSRLCGSGAAAARPG